MSDPARNAETSIAAPDYAGMPLGEFLEAVAAAEPAPGGGAAAATSAALAAALAGMAARLSGEQLTDAPALADRADRLRERALQLASDDAEAYEALLAARRMSREDPDREEAVGRAAAGAADVPLRISAAAREAAALAVRLAVRLAGEGNPNLRGDAVTAAFLAEGAARSAAELVSINAGDDDWRARRARGMCEEARALARCASGENRAERKLYSRPPP